MRVDSKQKLLEEIDASWEQLWELFDSVDAESTETRIRQTAKAEPRSVKDVLAHLHAWHKLFLTWFQSGSAGQPEMPSPGFKWNQTPQLNEQLFEAWKDIPLASVRRRLKLSHGRVRKITSEISEKELLTPHVFQWTGNLSLGKYIGSSTVSHYKWATKSIRRIVSRIED